MLKNKGSIKGLIINLDSILRYLKNNTNSVENNFLELNRILYPNQLNKQIWEKEIIFYIEKFFISLIKVGLPIFIITKGNTYFINIFLKSCKDFRIFNSKLMFFDEESIQTLLVELDKISINISNLMIIGDNIFYFKFKFYDKAKYLLLIKLTERKDYKFKFIKYNFVSNSLKKILFIVKKNIFPNLGKLPNIFLKNLLFKYKIRDFSVITGPSIGEDTAVVAVEGEEVLVLKTDPITFPSDNIGYYAIVINSNDMATSGILPKWILAVLLFPPEISIYRIEKLFKFLYEACLKFNIILCGGHTEITDAVSRPVLIGTILGVGKRKNIIDKKNIINGDILIMTKGAGIEGTAIIATEFKKILLNRGVSKKDIKKSLEFKKKMSILKEAKISWKNSGVSALHDVTEGGIATAIYELSEVSGYGIKIFLNKIFISKYTQKLCDIMNISPLGLVGSGSLLICCHRNKIDALIEEMKKQNIMAYTIGEITQKGHKIEAFNSEKISNFPQFEVDELTKLF